MWYFILALLFGNPSDANTNSGQTTIQTARDGDGGDTGQVRPPKG
ncbi:hypothetical protein [Sphingobacterium sp. SRCM116780]|nr:hypothetical protein [Sphingobacterium sp. SRCM116780]